MMSRFWVTTQFWKKCTAWPQNDLDTFKVKDTRGPNFRPFRSTMSHWFSSNTPFNDTKWPWQVPGQKCQYACCIHPRGPNFRPFHSAISCFWVTPIFREQCTKWPQMTLTCSRSKLLICMHAIYPRSSNCRPFRSTMHRCQVTSQFRETCTELPPKWPWLDMFKIKNTKDACYTHTRGPNWFSSISLYVEPFLRYAPFSRKVHRMTSKWPWHVQGQRYTYAYNLHPPCPSFRPFLELCPPFQKSALNDPKWPWHVNGQKYHYAYYIHPSRPASTMGRFRVTPLFFFRKVHWMTPPPPPCPKE